MDAVIPLRLSAADAERVRRLRGQEPDAFYPAQARRDAVDGYVIVALTLNELGFVLEAEVVRESPTGMGFGLAALDTVKTWEFDNPFRTLVRMETLVAFQP